MKNLFIIGDSLACPRPWEGIGFNDTYGARIQRCLKETVYVVSLAEGSKSTRDYTSDSFIKTNVCSASMNYLVIQLGIVDCAPRLMTVFERFIGYALSKVGIGEAVFGAYAQWKSKHRLFFTRWFPHVLVDIEEYKANLDCIVKEYVSRNPIETIIFINIAYPGDSLVQKSWGILKNIEKHNEVLASLGREHETEVSIVDLFSATKKNKSWITQDDGHHIKIEAHEWISDSIVKVFQ